MKILERLRALPSVNYVSVENDGEWVSYFTYLNPGWEWSEQRGFGTETVTEAYRLARKAKYVGDGKNIC